jgi:Ca-activated chloride channel family protein
VSHRAVASLALALSLAAGCAPGAREARRGERLYDAGSYRESYEAFRRAHQASRDPAIAFNAASALYRLKRYDQAAQGFRAVAAGTARGGRPRGAPGTSRDERRGERSWYNLGNAAVRAAEDAAADKKGELLDQAVAAYEEALRLDPGDLDAKWNLELALRRRAEDATGSSSGRNRRGDYGQGRQNVPGYEGNPEAAVGAMAGGGFGSGEGESAQELSESEARQLLDAVQREQLSSHLGRRAGRSGGDAHDW